MKNKWLVLLIFALLISGVISLFASSYPDGLEASAEHIGLMAEKKSFFALFPDYLLPGISNEILSASLAGVIGTLLIYTIIFLFIKLLNKKTKQKNLPPT